MSRMPPRYDSVESRLGAMLNIAESFMQHRKKSLLNAMQHQAESKHFREYLRKIETKFKYIFLKLLIGGLRAVD
jgi:hypothetical protein